MALPVSGLCGRATQLVQLDSSNNDHILNLGHCATCQAVSGQLCTAYYLLQGEPRSLDSLEEYQSDGVSRYFCETCGCQSFAYSKQTGQYFVASGLVDTPPQTKNARHWGVGDTWDGGLTSFLPGFLISGSNDAQDTVEQTNCNMATEDSRQLLAQCHCGGIELYITPPDSTSTEAWSPWPDLIIPYHSGPEAAENKEDIKWWLQDNRTKYMAGTCACRTCRLASGFPIQSWAFIPKSNILTAANSPLTYDALRISFASFAAAAEHQCSGIVRKDL